MHTDRDYLIINIEENEIYEDILEKNNVIESTNNDISKHILIAAYLTDGVPDFTFSLFLF